MDTKLMEALTATYQVHQVYHYQSSCSLREPLREFYRPLDESAILLG
jgi:hypothetical protein